MTKKNQIYKCEICGNIVHVIHDGIGELFCCGQPMKLLDEQTKDASIEKHVPYIEKTANGYLVKVGQNQEHPMEEKHHIEWIELIADGVSHREYLSPGDKSQAEFCVTAKSVSAREYCNIHGLWKSA